MQKLNYKKKQYYFFFKIKLDFKKRFEFEKPIKKQDKKFRIYF